MRFAMYAGASTVLATGVVLRALHQRANFYSATVYLAQSNACLMILTNLALLGVASFMLGLQRLFFGTLRPIEVEQLYEKGWFAITETCLAMTIFREEVGAYFLVMFVCLLIGKVWGWIGEGRVEILEQQPPANPRLFHLRLSTSLIISTLFDMYMLLYSVQTVLQQARPNMMVVFAFEFAVLHVTSLSTAARYTISLYEASVIKNQTKTRREQIRQERAQARRQAAEADTSNAAPVSTNASEETDVDNLDIDVPGWEEKGRWIFYLDLTTDFFKLVLYLTFFCVLCMFYGMPIHIIRDVALTIRSFYKRIHDFVRYRQATKDMNDRYPDATPEEVAREDVCIICREDMRAWGPAVQNANAPARPAPTALDERTRPKKLPCGHILHFACLRSWLERQQNCPTCRRPVLAQGPTGSTTTVNAAGQNIGAGPQPNQQQAPNAGHAVGQQPVIAHNVFNFGPFRLAFGARIGGQGLPPQMNHFQPAGPIQQGQAADPQGIGNGFGLFRPAQQRTAATSTPLDVPAQLQQIEQQIMRDVNALRVQADQLYLIRSLQGELARLRIQQAQANHIANENTGQIVHQQAAPNPVMPVVPFQNTPQQIFTADHQQQSLGHAHPELPPGMTLPEGWTVLPLHRVNQINPIVPQPSNPTLAPSFHTPTAEPALAHNIVSDPSSSMTPNPPPSTAFTSQNDAHPSITTQAGPAINVSNGPLPQSSTAEAENAMQHERSNTAAPEEPSKPRSSPSIPNWGSSSTSQPNQTATEHPEGSSSAHTPMNGHPKAPNHADDDDEASAAERRQAKGKGRAVTVEDLVDDVD